MPLISWGSSKSWSNQARQPKCGPPSRGMTLMEAAEQMSGSSKRALKKAEEDLATARRRNDKTGIKVAQTKIKKIRGR